MEFTINEKKVATDEQGFICDPEDWSEEFVKALAEHLNIKLYVDHWELIWYFREYYEENLVHPTMRQLVMTLGSRPGKPFKSNKSYERHLYKLFPAGPIHEICKLAGLPRPEPDT